MKETVLQLIKEAARNNNFSLDLSDNQLTSLPPEIAKLKNLTELNLASNRLTALSPEIAELKNITKLNLSDNRLAALPPEIAELKNLTELNLDDNWFISLPSEIIKLKNITKLNLASNQLTSLPPEIAELKNLTELTLFHNWVTSLPPEIIKLKNLTTLDLASNQLTSLPPEIAELKNLTRLYLSKNRLTALPPNITKLRNLTELNLFRNWFTSLPPAIAELKNLTTLDLTGNQLTALPPAITELNLEILLDDEYTPYGIFVRGNPIETPPIDIIKKGKEAVKEYFKSLEGETQALNEVKVLLIGDGGSGKTSLSKRLIKNEFDPHELQTHGIKINEWDIKERKKEIKVNFWDFGGQEIMHATHQFFLSKRSLYILVLDGRKEEKTEYWLKHVQSFGGNSPVLIVLNKVDENPMFEVDRKFLQEKYPSIKGFYRLSCKSGKGIEDFKENLVEQLTSIDHLKTVWPKSWFKVKTQLEKSTDHYIKFEKYEEICESEGITKEESQETLVDFLNDLGVVLHFSDDNLLDTHVLNPKWVTEAVYKIITSDKLQNKKGMLKTKLLTEILKKKNEIDYQYPRNTHKFIIDLMEKFELCYFINKNTILIPDLLEIQQPDFKLDNPNSLKFIIEYNFLPNSIMPRFIVRNHTDIKKGLQWRNGVVLEDKSINSMSIIKVDKEDKKIYIYVDGESKKEYLSIIRKSFREINAGFENMPVKELVPLPDNPIITIDYKELVAFEKASKDEYFVWQLNKNYSVKQLLHGVENERERKTAGNHPYQPVNQYNIGGNAIISGENSSITIDKSTNISINDRKELHENLMIFKNEIAKLGLPDNELSVVNGNINTAIEESEKDQPNVSRIATKFKNAFDTAVEVGDNIEKVSSWEWTHKIAKIVGLGSMLGLV